MDTQRREYCDPDYDPDIDLKKLVVRLAYVGFVVCGLLYAVGLVIV